MKDFKKFQSDPNRIPQIHSFISIVMQETIDGASKTLNISPETIKDHIDSLQDGLGVVLFKSINGKLKLTEAGKVFYELSTSITDEVNNLFKDFKTKIKEEKEHHILIAGHQFMMSHHLPQKIYAVKKSFPNNQNLEFIFFNIPQEEAIDKLSKGELDAIFYNVDQANYPEFKVTKIIEEDFILTYPNTNTYFNKINDKDITWNDIMKNELIITSNYYGASLPSYLDNYHKKVEFINGTYEMIKHAIYNNLGVSYCPASYISEDDKKYGNYKVISHLTGKYICSAVTNKNVRCKTFISKLIDRFLL